MGTAPPPEQPTIDHGFVIFYVIWPELKHLTRVNNSGRCKFTMTCSICGPCFLISIKGKYRQLLSEERLVHMDADSAITFIPLVGSNYNDNSS